MPGQLMDKQLRKTLQAVVNIASLMRNAFVFIPSDYNAYTSISVILLLQQSLVLLCPVKVSVSQQQTASIVLLVSGLQKAESLGKSVEACTQLGVRVCSLLA